MSSNLKSGALRITPRQYELNDFSLDVLLDTLGGHLLTPELEEGWGSVEDDDALIGHLGHFDVWGGRPSLVGETAIHPRRLFARLYWRETDRQAVKYNSPDGAQYIESVDCIFSVGKSGYCDVLIATRSSYTLDVFESAVLSRLEEMNRAPVTRATSPLSLGVDGDFYLWLLSRVWWERSVSADLLVSALDKLSGADSTSWRRGTSWQDGVDGTRADVLAHLALGENTLGPATLSVSATSLGLDTGFELATDGSFSPILRESFYHGRRVDRASIGARLVSDLGYHVVPALIAAHRADKAWLGGERRVFLEQVRVKLADYSQHVSSLP